MSMLATYIPQPFPSPPSHPDFAMNMFTMAAHNQHPFAFAQAAPPPPRQYTGHGTSSAFSSSANPDEDWTKISDLAERRRIQNRIAQRNYRKKLKRRLEDLERRAGSPDSAEADKPSPPATKAKRPSQSKASKPRAEAPKPAPQMQFTPPMDSTEEFVFQQSIDDRERSHSPPMYSYTNTYPPPDESMLAHYGTAQPYQAMGSIDAYPTYLSPAATLASTVPSMTHFSDAFKRDSYSSEVGLNQYSPYAYYSGVDVNGPSPYDQSNPHTPPLSHTFDHSANCSESGFDYPATPLSMPASPGMVHPQQM